MYVYARKFTEQFPADIYVYMWECIHTYVCMFMSENICKAKYVCLYWHVNVKC